MKGNRTQTMGGGGDAGKLRQQLVQARSQMSDLEEELQEKNGLYQTAIQERDAGKARVAQAEEALGNVEALVAAKVAQVRSKEEKKNQQLRAERDGLAARVKDLDDQLKTLQSRLEKMSSGGPRAGGGGDESLALGTSAQLQKYAREMDKKDRELQEAQKYSNYL